MKSSKLMK